MANVTLDASQATSRNRVEDEATQNRTGAEVLIAQLAARGVKRIFGMPGGECSLDVIEAAKPAGIEFVLARNENSAAMMAAVTADLTGSLGVVMTTRGPGIANAMNGIACASLDRVPLLLIADGWEYSEAFMSYQRYDQMALLKPLVKGSLRLDTPTALPALGPLLNLAMSEPGGTVFLEVTGSGMRGTVAPHAIPVQPTVTPRVRYTKESIAAAKAAIARASRPVIVAGFQARDARTTEALRKLVKRWQCPVFTTYKGKGIIPDDDPLLIGHYIGGAGEDAIMRAADLFVFFGADPIEFAMKPWPYQTPVVEFLSYAFPLNYFLPEVSVVGDIAEAAAEVEPALSKNAWTAQQLTDAKADMQRRALMQQKGGITPQMLIQAARAAMPSHSIVTVDSGAHMIPVMALCEAHQPRDVVISKGLATMAFALPAGIGAALAFPERRVVAFTGDGGLMMCAGELATAAQSRCNLTVVVLNDSSLSLIAVKQKRRQLPKSAVDYSSTDFSIVAQGFGCKGFRVEKLSDLAGTLKKAMECEGPSLIDVLIDPASYHEEIKALRG